MNSKRIKIKRVKIIFFVDRPHFTYEILKILRNYDIPLLSLEVYSNVIYLKLPYISESLLGELNREFSSVYGFEKMEEIDYSAVEERDLELRTVLDFIPQGVFLLDKDGKIRYANTFAVESLLGLKGELEGLPISQWFNSEKLENLLRRQGKGEDLSHEEVELEGEIYELSTKRIFTDENIFCGLLVYLHEQSPMSWYESSLNFKDIAGTSAAIRNVLERAKYMTDLMTPVVIYGEGGTGKGILARAIHNEGLRSHRPFISINCAAVPGKLLEEELFENHLSLTTRRGRGLNHKIANESTLFIDGLGQMPLHIQQRLYQVLEEEERVWGGQGGHDIRLICSTNKSLDQLREEKRLTDEWYELLKPYEIFIPPLRERKEDLLPQVYDLIKAFNERYELEVEGLDEGATKKIQNYFWPNNLRELQDVIERAVLSAKGGLIREDDILIDGKSPMELYARTDLKEAVEGFERNFIVKELKKSRSIRDAAQRMGVTHTLLRNRMIKYGIKPGEWKEVF